MSRVAADPKSAVNGKPKFNPAQPWRVEDSLDLYNVNAWGKGYFSINDAGHVVVRPDTQPGTGRTSTCSKWSRA